MTDASCRTTREPVWSARQLPARWSTAWLTTLFVSVCLFTSCSKSESDNSARNRASSDATSNPSEWAATELLQTGDIYFDRALAMHLQGVEPDSSDVGHAVRFYELAASKGATEALVALGLVHRHNLSRIAASDAFELAEDFLTQAFAQSQDGFAALCLGDLYCEGVELDGAVMGMNHTKAFDWFQKSVKHGQRKGHSRIGHMYEFGLGVTEDLAMAERHYRSGLKDPEVSSEDVERVQTKVRDRSLRPN